MVEVRVEVQNHGEDRCLIQLQDHLPSELNVIEGSPNILTILRKGEVFGSTIKLRCARGIYSPGELSMLVSEPLGSHFKRSLHSPQQTILSLPIPRSSRSLIIRPRRTKVFAGMIPANRGGQGNEFFSVRPYADGDSLQHINWRASAKHDARYYINLFQQERVADVAILVDARLISNQMLSHTSLLDYSVQAAATVASSLLANGNRVGLLSFGSHLEWTFPGYGRIQRERILRALAKVREGESQIFNELKNLPTRLFPAQSQLILISPLLNEDYRMLVQLKARGYQVLVISPDWIEFETDTAPRASQMRPLAIRIAMLERQLLLRKIGQAGVLVLPWNLRLPVEQMLNRSHRSPILWLRSSGSP